MLNYLFQYLLLKESLNQNTMRFCHAICEGASVEGAQVCEMGSQSGHLETTWESAGDWWNLYSRSHPHHPHHHPQKYSLLQIQIQTGLSRIPRLWLVHPRGWQWKLFLWWRMIFVLSKENLKERLIISLIITLVIYLIFLPSSKHQKHIITLVEIIQLSRKVINQSN